MCTHRRIRIVGALLRCAWTRTPSGVHPTRYPRRRAQLAAKPCLCACRLQHCSRPSFAPTQASLRNAIERASTTRLGSPHSVLQGLDSAYVLIFNAGQQDEGVYTLQGRAAQANAYVLAFELNDDAGRFAQLLQAEGFVSRRPFPRQPAPPPAGSPV